MKSFSEETREAMQLGTLDYTGQRESISPHFGASSSSSAAAARKRHELQRLHHLVQLGVHHERVVSHLGLNLQHVLYPRRHAWRVNILVHYYKYALKKGTFKGVVPENLVLTG